jgi:hypothetical protein
MDINKIFKLFENSETLNAEKQVFKDINEHPLFWINMFTRIILNYTNSKSAHLMLFKTIFPDLDINDISNAGEYIIYTKSYVFLKRLNIECELDLQVIQNNTNSEFLTALESSLSYYEKYEEYEKCSFILSIINIIKVNLS